jgi:hypothetical protein
MSGSEAKDHKSAVPESEAAPPSSTAASPAAPSATAAAAAAASAVSSNGAVVVTLAGSGEEEGFADGPGASAQFAFPHGIAFDAAANRVLIADGGNHRVRALDLATG